MNGTKLGRYTLIRQLARGGMSEVYLAQRESDEQVYALKVVRQEDERHYQRLQRELQALSKLEHPHILPVLDYGEQDGIGYCVTPYIEHGTLKERIAEGPLSIEETDSILAQVADALQFIHEAGLVHRDIKPGNVLLDDTGQVWLTDFGLAKEMQADSDLTDSNCLMGTPFYMAPELVEHPASATSDIYALGVVLYEMVTGRPPFTGQTPLLICWKHVYELPQPPSIHNPLLSPSLDRVILRALEKDPALRFSGARDLAAAYHQALSSADLTMSVLEDTSGTTFAVQHVRSIKVAPQGRPRARHLAVAVVLMATLFTLGASSLVIGYQGPSSGPAVAGAQMLSLQGQATRQPTVQPTRPTNVPVRQNGYTRPHGTNHGDHVDHGDHGKH